MKFGDCFNWALGVRVGVGVGVGVRSIHLSSFSHLAQLVLAGLGYLSLLVYFYDL